MQHTEWMALATAKADGPRTLEELSESLREWAAQHRGPFELPELTKQQLTECLEMAARSVCLAATVPSFAAGELFVGEHDYIDTLIDHEFFRHRHNMQIALLPVEVREEIEARRDTRRL